MIKVLFILSILITGVSLVFAYKNGRSFADVRNNIAQINVEIANEKKADAALVAECARLSGDVAKVKGAAEGSFDFKVVKECKLPLTAPRCVARIVTDLAVMDVKPDGLHLVEVAPGVTVEEVQRYTEPTLILPQSGVVPVMAV